MKWSGTQLAEKLASKRPTSPAGETRLSRRQAIFTAACVFGTAAFVETNTQASKLETTHHTVSLANLDRPLRVVQITDLHRSRFVLESFINRVVVAANALRPDLILLTGDFVTGTSEYAESCMRPLSALRAPLGCFAVLGNHDYWCDGGMGGPVIAEWLEQTGIEVLTNQNTKLANGLRVVGVDDLVAGVPNYAMSLAGIGAREPVLAMCHNPQSFYKLSEYNYLTISGHTHGGQVYVPALTDMLIGSRFLRGWYQLPGSPGRMFVSRGLGTVHVPMRLCSTPELAVFDVVPA